MTPSVATPETIQKRNRFGSFEEFKEFVRDKFINGSAIALQLFEACIEFHTDTEILPGAEASFPIHEVLGWNLTRFGQQSRETLFAAFLKNEDGSIWQIIISDWDDERQRPYKYLAPKGSGDRPFLPPIPISIRQKISARYNVKVPESGSFWEWLESCHSNLEGIRIPLILTEGGKKSLCLISLGYVGISLYGCTCGGKEELIPVLKYFNGEGVTWLLALDQDSKLKTKKLVNANKKRLTRILQRDGFLVYIGDIIWSEDQGKGVDDFIVKYGFGAFDASYAKAIARVEKQMKGAIAQLEPVDKTANNPPPDQVAGKIAEDYRHILAFNNDTKQWMHYEVDFPGVWSVESNEYLASIVCGIVESIGITSFGSEYIDSIIKLLRHKLIVRKWMEVSPRDYLPFRNGVVEIATEKLLDHAPGYRLTWQLPRDYSSLVGSWSVIDAFLNHFSAGDLQIKEILICYCNAVIKGRYDLQKFLHLIGLGGTGKGTFSRLLTALIGQQNVLSTTLEDWCTNHFEGANAYKKRLILFPDEDPFRGKIGKFLSLTGGDDIRGEYKNQQAFNFKFDGMVLVLSNHPVFTGGSASRAKRRTITIPCNNPVLEVKRRDLEKEFEPELAAFTNHLLSLSDEYVTKVLRGVWEVPKCTLEFWTNQMREDYLASWVNDCVVFDANARTNIGKNINEAGMGAEPVTLIGSYARYCREAGGIPKGVRNFSPDLKELCQVVLGWSIEKVHTNKGEVMQGIRLRVPGTDDHIPTWEQQLEIRISSDKDSTTIAPTPLPLQQSVPQNPGFKLEMDYQANLFTPPHTAENEIASPPPEPQPGAIALPQPTNPTFNLGNATFKVSDWIEFHEGDLEWRKGRIVEIYLDTGLFGSVTIEVKYRYKVRRVVIARNDWLREPAERRSNSF